MMALTFIVTILDFTTFGDDKPIWCGATYRQVCIRNVWHGAIRMYTMGS